MHKFTVGCATMLLIVGTVCAGERKAGSLNGPWQISVDEGRSWTTARVPGTFEQQLDREFDGIAWLRRSFRLPTIPAGQRLYVQFDAIATDAEVLVNGRMVGRHAGGWTPFRCDITDAATASDASSPSACELLVKVDEKVGHNTQGFLPIIAPHFGGIWQDVQWILLPEGALDDLTGLVSARLDDQTFELALPFVGGSAREGDELQMAVRGSGEPAWGPGRSWHLTTRGEAGDDSLVVNHGRIAARVPFASVLPGEKLQAWCPAVPHRYEVRLQLLRQGQVYDEWRCWVAFRKVETRGRHLWLNGQPLIVRGLLNWGYQQDRNAPSIDPAVMRCEIAFAQARGFNLMKFCLWIPPKDYLHQLDERGLLGWVEYPAWHPQFTPQYLAPLRREYQEFFYHDRMHASVILRSLTCETGTSADLGVIRSLYQLCHDTVPNSLVEDDSSWIEWNRVHDFYDDHPYGNNHTWVATLRRLNRYIDEREAKPLILGEAIAADTWFQPGKDKEAMPSPPIFHDENRRWLAAMTHQLNAGSLDSLAEDSLHYAQLMRKYQIETFRREVPEGGYVVSVIRDFSLAGMGLIDYFDRPKTSRSAWQWHGDNMLLLKTEMDRRSFRSRDGCQGEILLACGSRPWTGGTLTLRAHDHQQLVRQEQDEKVTALPGGAVHSLAQFDWQLGAAEVPTRVEIEATLHDEKGEVACSNRWPIWWIPPVKATSQAVSVHRSWNLGGERLERPQEPRRTSADDSVPADRLSTVWLTRSLDEELLSQLESGARVLLVPDGGPGSPPLQAHWFLRGGPVVNQSAVDPSTPRQLLVELQHFDLAHDVIADLHDQERLHLLVALWDNHDLPRVKTHGLVLEMPVGTGWLLVSALRHDGPTNAAGEWLLRQWVERLSQKRVGSTELGRKNLDMLREQIHTRELPRVGQEWRFQPDADHVGPAQGWHRPDWDDHDWPVLGIDRHWEAQGHETLDGWAWYRTSIQLPEDWPADHCYLSFTGVDDYYRCYVNGQRVGTGGDLERRQTAFDERKSHDIARQVRPGEIVHVAVEVYDWYGAGGIFRPVTVSTAPISVHAPLFQPAGR